MIKKVSCLYVKNLVIPKNFNNLHYIHDNIPKNYNAINVQTISPDTIFKYHIEPEGEVVPFPNLWPVDYIYLKSTEFVKAVPEHIDMFGNLIKEIPSFFQKVYAKRSHYKLDRLISAQNGDGTECIKQLVKNSIASQETEGRIILDACCIDGKTSPAGFYYKLGFRFNIEKWNKEFENWVKSKGNIDDSPFILGSMYLPKENIQHCLNYGL